MAKRKRNTSHPRKNQTPIVAERYDISTGQAEVRACDDIRGNWVLHVNGVPSSPYNPDNPEQLGFEYLALMAELINLATSEQDAWRAIHIGGGACALARSLIATHPRSNHLVVEYDETLANSIRSWLPLPPSPKLRIRAGDGLQVLKTRRDNSANIIIRDAFDNSVTPAHLTDKTYMAETRRVLTDDGLALFNVAVTSKTQARQEISEIANHFRDVAAIGSRPTLSKGKSGNVVVVAANSCDHQQFRQVLRSAKQPLSYDINPTGPQSP